MNRNDCKIVQDLLPNYIENLTSKETNDFIEEHLKKCKECKDIYDNMTKNIKIDNIKNNKKEVKYFKKFNNKLKNLKIIIIFIIVLILVISIFAYNNLKNIILLNSLEEKLTNINTSNYSYTTEMITDNEKTITKCFVLNEKYYVEIEKVNEKTIVKLYKDNKDDIILYDKDGTILYKINGQTNSKIDMNILPTNPKYFALDIYAISKNDIKEISKEGKYYVLNTKNNYKYWVEKDTGIVVKILSLDTNESMSFEYNFNNVKEDDIVKPDVSEYVK